MVDEQERGPERTHYANTDLELTADCEPSALKVAFDQHGFCDLWERTLVDSHWEGCFETGESYYEPDGNIVGFLSVIEALEAEALREWQACTRRAFDIGYHVGYEPFDFSQALSAETIRRIANVGASLRITVYAPDKANSPVSVPADVPRD